MKTKGVKNSIHCLNCGHEFNYEYLTEMLQTIVRCTNCGTKHRIIIDKEL